MEVSVPLTTLFPQDGLVSSWTASKLGQLRGQDRTLMESIIDDLGRRSQVAQGLKQPITTFGKMLASDYKLYLGVNVAERTVVGMIKVGVKKLFIRNSHGEMREIQPCCVLDFYVCENLQRQGYGKILLEHMAREERVLPHRLAIDRPSYKFTSFLARHYGLKEYIKQENNFVVFERYFEPGADAYDPEYFSVIRSVPKRPEASQTCTQGQTYVATNKQHLEPSTYSGSQARPAHVTPAARPVVRAYSPLLHSPYAVDLPGEPERTVSRRKIFN